MHRTEPLPYDAVDGIEYPDGAGAEYDGRDEEQRRNRPNQQDGTSVRHSRYPHQRHEERGC